MSFMSVVCEISLICKIASGRAITACKRGLVRVINIRKHSRRWQQNIDQMKNVNPRAPKAKAVNFKEIEQKLIEESLDENTVEAINKSGVNRKLLPAPVVANGTD